MMNQPPLYTIGHGVRKIEEFLSLLKIQQIEYLLDVRSTPYSRFNPQYNQKALKDFLNTHGIQYIFMGDTLGGRPRDTDCYDASGKIDYQVVQTKNFFQNGLQRLKTVHQKNLKAAIMCSESRPEQCHRSLLIGQALWEQKIPVQHIDEKGNLIDQQHLMIRNQSKFSQKNLFN